MCTAAGVGRRERFPRPRGRGLAGKAVVAALVAYGALPQESFAQQDWLGFRGTLGYEWLEGDLGRALAGGVRTEWTVMYFPRPAWPLKPRVGAGYSRVTYGLRPVSQPAIDVNANSRHWNHVRWHVVLGVERAVTRWVDAYLEVRQAWGRLRSQTEVLWPVPADDPPHDTPYRNFDDRSSELAGGLQVHPWSPRLEIDLLARWGVIARRGAPSFDLTDYGLPVLSDGKAWGIQIGVAWNP